MFIKQFRSYDVRVPDPLHPGRRATEQRLISSGAESLSHNGTTYTADADGWFDVPPELGATLLKVRYPQGESFFTPAEVNEEVRLGTTDDDALPTPKAPPKRKPAAE